MRPLVNLPVAGSDSDTWGPKVNDAIKAALSPGLRRFGGLRPIATHTGIPNNMLGGLSNGTDTIIETVVRHTLAAGNVSSISLVLPGGWYVNGSSGELDMPNSATISTAIELPSGTRIPVFVNGVRRAQMEIGSLGILCDPVAVTIKETDARYFLTRTRVTVTAGGKFVPNVVANNTYNTGEGVLRGTDDSVDHTLVGSIGTTAGFGIGPMLVLGESDAIGLPVNAENGDSIANGTADQMADGGFITRVIRALRVPSVKTTNAGGTNADVLLDSSWRRHTLTLGCTHAIHEGGVNDVRGGALTAAALKAQDIAKWRADYDTGKRVLVTTMTPTGTSSTDAFATVENQTILNGTAQAARIDRNNWIRAGAPLNPTTFAPLTAGDGAAVTFGQAGHPAVGYLEVADLVESARDSGKFIAGTTSDGLHIAAAKQISMATALTAPIAAFLGVTV
jgi:hypothetical protein